MATAAGVLVALTFGVIGIYQNKRLRLETARAQAERVVLAVNYFDLAEPFVLWNASEAPIFAIEVGVVKSNAESVRAKLGRRRLELEEVYREVLSGGADSAGTVSEALAAGERWPMPFSFLDQATSVNMYILFTDSRSVMWGQAWQGDLKTSSVQHSSGWQMISQREGQKLFSIRRQALNEV